MNVISPNDGHDHAVTSSLMSFEKRMRWAASLLCGSSFAFVPRARRSGWGIRASTATAAVQ